MTLQYYYPLFPPFPWHRCIALPASWLPQKTLPGSLFFFRTPAPAPQVVPVCTRLMTSAPPVCICGCKNSKVVTQNEKCFPSGYVVFSILTTTPQRRRMNVEEEEVVLEILCETSFDWQHSVTVPKSSAFYWLLNSLIFWQISSPACCLSSLGYWDIVKKQQKKHLACYPRGTGTQDERSSSQFSADGLVAERRLLQPWVSFWPWWPEFWSCVPDYFLSCCWLLRPTAWLTDGK